MMFTKKSVLFIVMFTVLATLVAANHAPLSDGLVTYWTFDGDLLDQSHNEFDGVPIWSLDCNVAGVSGQGCFINNDGNFLAADVPFQATEPNGFAFSTWVNFQDTTGGKLIASLGDFKINYMAGGGLDCNLVDASGAYMWTADFSYLPTANQWDHIVCSYDPVDSSLRLYVNNVEVSSNDASGFSSFSSASLSEVFGLGCNNIWWCPTDGVAPVIYDEVRVYNRALTSTDVNTLFTSVGTTNPSVCGNSIIETGEVCDNDAQSCTTSGYSGSQACNAQCTGYDLCTTSESCGDNIINGNEVCDDGSLNGQENQCNSQCTGITVPSTCGNGVLDSGEVCDQGASNGQEHSCNAQCSGITTPVYSNGSCPVLTAGRNSNFVSGTYNNREFNLYLPQNPQNSGVVFAYHYLGGNPDSIASELGLQGLEDTYDFIIVSPVATGDAQYEWFTGTPPPNNPDVDLFDDVVACLYDQYNADPDRVWVTGHSAGAAWTSYLSMYRSNDIAGVVTYNGGLQSPTQYVSPSSQIPTVLFWGGPTDTYFEAGANFDYNNGNANTYSFHEASLDLSSRYQQDGNFVVECQDTIGHNLPVNPVSYAIPFLMDHPNWVNPEPYADALPAAMPSICVIPGVTPVCGNGIVETGEVCDSSNQICTASGYSGTQSCNAQCTGYDLCTTSESCGDNIVNGNEVCDGNSQSCTTTDGYSGTETCNLQCNSFDTCLSTEVCGDGIINGNEVCDDSSLNGLAGSCNLICSATLSATCGNGIQEVGEVCW